MSDQPPTPPAPESAANQGAEPDAKHVYIVAIDKATWADALLNGGNLQAQLGLSFMLSSNGMADKDMIYEGPLGTVHRMEHVGLVKPKIDLTKLFPLDNDPQEPTG